MNGSESSPWIWAVGIEDTFIAQTERGERPLDEYELTQHYRFWKEDMELVRTTGVSMIRYGIPWYKIEPEEGRYDWSWTDQVMAYFAEHRELQPIIDLMHYGTPLWMEKQFLNPGYPEAVSRYAAAFAERYSGIVSHYTPLNEPFINAEWCGWSGTWPPYLKGLKGFVRMLIPLCKGIIHTVRRIKVVQPESIMIHVEAAKKYVPAHEGMAKDTELWNEIRYVMWELVQGRVGEGHPLKGWLLRHGAADQELAWFRKNPISLDIVGINYYPQFSINMVDRAFVEEEKIPDSIPGTGDELIEIATDIYKRYGRPVFITETSYRGTEAERIHWLEELVHAAYQLKENGVELAGVTWFPFLDMADWPYRTNGLPLKDNIARFGLYTLEERADGTLVRLKNKVAERFEEEIRKSKLK